VWWVIRFLSAGCLQDGIEKAENNCQVGRRRLRGGREEGGRED
jgi:hypothetical protein